MTSSCINWEQYSKTAINCFQSSFNRTDYSDVTLVSDDDFQKFSAHRVILSSCSSTFQKILSQSQHQSTIFMRGYNSKQLENILTFIYKGQVEIPTRDLNYFVENAQELNIININNEVKNENPKTEGPIDEVEQQKKDFEQLLQEIESEGNADQGSQVLENPDDTDMDESSCESTETGEILNETINQQLTENVPVENKDPMMNTNDTQTQQEVIEQHDQLAAEQMEKMTKQRDDLMNVAVANMNRFKEEKMKQEEVEMMMSEVVFKDGVHHCPQLQCGYKTKRKELLRVHMSSTHGGPKYYCTYLVCSRVYSSRANLRSHMRSYHKCDKCEEEYELNSHLKKHKKKNHPAQIFQW